MHPPCCDSQLYASLHLGAGDGQVPVSAEIHVNAPAAAFMPRQEPRLVRLSVETVSFQPPNRERNMCRVTDPLPEFPGGNRNELRSLEPTAIRS